MLAGRLLRVHDVESAELLAHQLVDRDHLLEALHVEVDRVQLAADKS